MDQQVTKINIDNPTTLFGLKVRTSNMNEMSGKGAKIAGLWQQFYTDIAPNLTPSSKVYGVYTHYESDVTGEFDVFACTDQQVTSPETEQTTLATGNYLRFSAKGAMPQTVIDVWGQVWQYFSNEQCPHIRAYKTDFEFYKSSEEVEVFISVE